MAKPRRLSPDKSAFAKSIAATLRRIAAQYVWPSMNKDVRMSVKQCLQCQPSKVLRHVAAFATPDARFDHVHTDIVGPLPPSHGLDTQCSAAELVYGTTFRLPREFFTPRSSNDSGKSDYAQRLSKFMRTLPPVSTRIQHRQDTPPRELSTCSHVFIRVQSVRKPLQQPYEGPFHMIFRREKTLKVDRQGRIEVVSIDRLKLAHVDHNTSETSLPRPSQEHVPPAASTDETSVSRSGRRARLTSKSITDTPISAKAGLINDALVIAFSRYSGFESVWHMFGLAIGHYGRFWFHPTSAAFPGPQPSDSGHKHLWCGTPTGATNIACYS
ncbi:unnamed protein product [Schistosoma curassoni]|uniref:Integrase_H2C2 domain-containing protein n=1 Tax=Schistosoma curassoni TaxID=6186 RepID=A0A183KBT2_9TREM|nr:unnamed protein product [Schistosoma curassoni]